MLKVLITGHTKGIGKALAECFANDGHEVIGFSRSEGNDIADAAVRDTLLNVLMGCDVFVNNAYVPIYQHELLESAYTMYSDTDKYIIHIGSKIIDEDPKKLENHEWFITYYNNKTKSQEFIEKNLYGAKTALRIINVIPGFIETDMTKHVDYKKIKVDKLANFVYDVFKMRNDFLVEEVKINPSK